MFGRFTLALLASASLLPIAALAQEPTTSEEIVVTANKREELIREVPQSVTAITAETFARTQANDLQDYVARVPGMAAVSSLGEPGTTTVVLRGISAGGGTSSTATYVDETPYGFSPGVVGRGAQMTPDLDPSDLARLEVLRGPQGTLYGASAMGGVVKFVTLDPTADFSGTVRAGIESTEDGDLSYAARVGVNIPLGERAGIRLSGFHREEGGYIDDVTGPYTQENANSSETQGFRAKLVFHATNDLTIRLSTAQQEFSTDNDGGVDYVRPPLLVGPGPFPESVPMTSPVAGALEQDRQLALPASVLYRVHNGTVDWDFGWASLLSSTSYSEYENDSVKDGTPFFGGLVNDDFASDKFTQEFRLTSPGVDQGLDWMLGLFYTDESGDLTQDIFTGPIAGSFVHTTVDYEETAAFGTLTYHFSRQFDVSGGVRYAQSESDVLILTGGAFGFLGTGNQSNSDSVTTWSASARWRPSERTMAYARVATGWRAGGPNLPFPPLPATYEADTLTNYEIGVKSDLIDNVLRLDVALFRIDWEDMHAFVTAGGIGGNGNADTATSQGVEWEATLTPAQGLSVRWSGAYTNAELTADAPLINGLQTLGPQAVDGAPLPYAPEWASTLSIDYEWTAFNNVEAFVGGDVRYTGERVGAFSGPDPLGDIESRVELPAITIVDLRAGLNFEHFGVQLFARNVGNDDSPMSFGGAYGADQASVPRPRTVGLELSAKF